MVCRLCICLVDLAFPIVSRFSMQTLLPGQMFTAFFVVMAVLAGAYVLKGCFYYIITYWGASAWGYGWRPTILAGICSPTCRTLSFSF